MRFPVHVSGAGSAEHQIYSRDVEQVEMACPYSVTHRLTLM